MQAIHNILPCRVADVGLFQRAKIQVKCKQFTTKCVGYSKDWRCFKEQRYKLNASNSQLLSSGSHLFVCCFKEQRYKLNASNSQRYFKDVMAGSGCFKEQRYKLNASNSQLSLSQAPRRRSCFKEQRYKLNASNSQHASDIGDVEAGCFKEQRYKLNASNSQLEGGDDWIHMVVSKSKDTSLFAQLSKIFHAGFQPALSHRISLFSRKVS